MGGLCCISRISCPFFTFSPPRIYSSFCFCFALLYFLSLRSLFLSACALPSVLPSLIPSPESSMLKISSSYYHFGPFKLTYNAVGNIYETPSLPIPSLIRSQAILGSRGCELRYLCLLALYFFVFWSFIFFAPFDDIYIFPIEDKN